jgi:molybdopterin-guanine dinucleotide biosynthesis protein A
MRAGALGGIFVGGAGSRMGGVAKGLMRTAEGTTIVERWRAILARLGMRVVLVGDAESYASLGAEIIPDDPSGIGPLGGLAALLRRAGAERVLALACDMPFVSRSLVERLLAAPEDARIVAPRRAGRWEPLCARYDAAHVLPTVLEQVSTRDHSLQRLLDRAGAAELPLTSREADELRDWDSPEDVS